MTCDNKYVHKSVSVSYTYYSDKGFYGHVFLRCFPSQTALTAFPGTHPNEEMCWCGKQRIGTFMCRDVMVTAMLVSNKASPWHPDTQVDKS